MKYIPEEENQQLYNQSTNKFQSNSFQLNDSLNQNNKPKWIYVNPSIYLIYCILNGLSLAAGCLLKLLYPMSRDSIGKKRLWTGLPIIRNNYFLFPIILNLIYFIWCIYQYKTNISIRNMFEKSILKYLKEIRCAFFFTNILLLIFFYILYYLVVLSIYNSYGFKLSGHAIASILSGGMIVNLLYTYEPFIKLKISPNFNKTISYINIFLYYHSIYTIFWSTWIFHKVPELILAFTISIVFLVFAHVINLDELILNLIDFNYPRRNPIILYK